VATGSSKDDVGALGAADSVCDEVVSLETLADADAVAALSLVVWVVVARTATPPVVTAAASAVACVILTMRRRAALRCAFGDGARGGGVGGISAWKRLERRATYGPSKSSVRAQAGRLAPFTGSSTAYSDVVAVTNSRFRFGPPNTTFDASSGIRTFPISVPSGS
jgi:hypothetical protein